VNLDVDDTDDDNESSLFLRSDDIRTCTVQHIEHAITCFFGVSFFKRVV
jgi:hypothetical protein